MAFELPGFRFTRAAGADLSAAQYHLVKLDYTVGPMDLRDCKMILVWAKKLLFSPPAFQRWSLMM